MKTSLSGPKNAYKAVRLLLLLNITGCAGQQVEFAGLNEEHQPVVGANIPIRSQFKGLPLVEPHITAHPRDNNHLLAAAMVVTDIDRPYESCRLVSFVSQDGGNTWQETAHNWWGYDPWTAILPNGMTVMSWIGTQGSFKDQYPVQFFSSLDGGSSWDDPLQKLEGGYDGTKITANHNQFYFTTVRFRDDMGADVILLRREAPGLFEEVAKIDGKGERLNFCEPVVLTNGKVIVPAAHYMKKVWVQVFDPKTQQLSASCHVSNSPGGAKGYMRLTADVSEASSFKDRIYFVRANGNEKKSEGIWLNYSTDEGLTWSNDIRIDLFDNHDQSKAMVASAAVNKHGVLGISWVDSQHDPAQKKNDLYFTTSHDGGKSFQRPVRISNVSTNPATAANGDVANKFPGGGHYLGITTKPDGSFQLLWSDSRSGWFELQTCNVKVR